MAEPKFQIHKLYVKDISFNIPHVEKIFLLEWKPELAISVDTSHNPLPDAGTYEVILKIACKVKSNKTDAFEADVTQVGIFEIINLPQDKLDHALNAYCPNLLYPYIRELISDLITRGGFPQLCLEPINFDAIHLKQKQKKQQSDAATSKDDDKDKDKDTKQDSTATKTETKTEAKKTASTKKPAKKKAASKANDKK